MSSTIAPEPLVPPAIIDPEPDETEPVIPEPDPTHTPVVPPREPETQPAEERAPAGALDFG